MIINSINIKSMKSMKHSNLKLYALICYRRDISCKTVLTIKRDLKSDYKQY